MHFHQRSPQYILEYIIDIGNETNAESSATTFLKVLLSHEVVEATWTKKEVTIRLDIGSESQAGLDEKKLSCANSLYPGRWKRYHQLEISGSFFKLARSKEIILSDGQQFWDGMWSYCQQKVA